MFWCKCCIVPWQVCSGKAKLIQTPSVAKPVSEPARQWDEWLVGLKSLCSAFHSIHNAICAMLLLQVQSAKTNNNNASYNPITICVATHAYKLPHLWAFSVFMQSTLVFFPVFQFLLQANISVACVPSFHASLLNFSWGDCKYFCPFAVSSALFAFCVPTNLISRFV